MRSLFRTEVFEQPNVLARMLRESRGAIAEAAQQIRAFDPRWAILAARGSSDNAARYAQYVLGAFNGLSVGLAAPSLITLYRAKPDLRQALTIGISQSGQSPDVVAVVEEARRQGGLTLAITADAGSPLAAASQLCITLPTGEESAVAATKTYTATLLALAMLSVALEHDGGASRWAELARLPGAAAETLECEGQIKALAAEMPDADRLVVLGRGFNYCTAFEIALKIKETCYLIAEPFSVADFLHGPVAMIAEGFPILLVAPTGRGAENLHQYLDHLSQRRARLVALSDDPEILRRAERAIRLPGGIPEWLSP